MTSLLSHSYSVRLWRERIDAPLRASLVPVGQPEEHQHFADLDALLTFLCQQAEEDPKLTNGWHTNTLYSIENQLKRATITFSTERRCRLEARKDIVCLGRISVKSVY